MKFKVKMIGCSNKQSRGNEELGKISIINIEKRFTFSEIISSSIKKVEFKDDLIEIQTRNTMYTFQEVI